MKRMLVVALLALATTSFASDQEPDKKATSNNDQSSNAEQQVRQVVKEWRDAKVRLDIEKLDRLTADDFFEANQAGDGVNKEQLLALYRSGYLQFDSIEPIETNVRVYGDTSVVTGIHRENVKYQGREVGGKLRYTQVYVKRQGRWQIVASQLTSILPVSQPVQ